MRKLLSLIIASFLFASLARPQNAVDKKPFEEFYRAADVPLIGYSVWSLAYGTNVVATLLDNHDPTGSEKRLKALAEHRGGEQVRMLHFADSCKQEQKYICIWGLPDDPSKPAIVLIMRFGPSTEADKEKGIEHADAVAFKFYGAFMEHRYPDLLFRKERDHAPR